MCLSFLVIEAEKLEVRLTWTYMVKLSGKKFTNMSDDTISIYFNYNLLDCVDNILMQCVVVLTSV